MHWSDPLKPENLLAIVRTVVGSDEEARKVVERTKSEEVKKLLGGNTDQAFKDGAFGLPYFVGESQFCDKCRLEANEYSDECEGGDRKVLGRRSYGAAV